ESAHPDATRHPAPAPGALGQADADRAGAGGHDRADPRGDRPARPDCRFGAPASERGPLEAVSLPRLAREVAELYRLGPEGAEVAIEVEGEVPAVARADEVKEALVNLLENSRSARAGTIRIRIRGATIAVEDDGCGIPA